MKISIIDLLRCGMISGLLLCLSPSTYATSAAAPLGGSSSSSATEAPPPSQTTGSSFNTQTQQIMKSTAVNTSNKIPYVFILRAHNDWHYANNSSYSPQYGGYIANCPDSTATLTILTLGSPSNVVPNFYTNGQTTNSLSSNTGDPTGNCACGQSSSCSSLYYTGSNSGEQLFQDVAGNNFAPGTFYQSYNYISGFKSGSTGQDYTVAVCGVLIPDSMVANKPAKVTTTTNGISMSYYPIQYKDSNGNAYIYTYNGSPFGRSIESSNPVDSNFANPPGSFNNNKTYTIFSATNYGRSRIDNICDY